MDKSQAEAIAEAILEPDKKAQEEIRRQRHSATQGLARRRKVAWFALVGAILGAGVAQLMGHRFPDGILWGGLSAAGVGWLFVTGDSTARRHDNAIER